MNDFKELYDELSPRVFYYLYRWVPDRAVCEDILQEAFVMLWRRRGDFATRKAAGVWLYSTARNLLLNHSRLEAGRRRILQNLADNPHSEDQIMIDAEESAIIARAIEALPPRTARVIRLGMENLSVPEIARAMGISENTVKTLKKSAYKTLREKLQHLITLFGAIITLI